MVGGVTSRYLLNNNLQKSINVNIVINWYFDKKFKQVNLIKDFEIDCKNSVWHCCSRLLIAGEAAILLTIVKLPIV
jgi:hypothetical protein